MLTLLLTALGVLIGFVARNYGENAEIEKLSKQNKLYLSVGIGAFFALILLQLPGLVGVILGYFLYPYLPAKFRR